MVRSLRPFSRSLCPAPLAPPSETSSAPALAAACAPSPSIGASRSSWGVHKIRGDVRLLSNRAPAPVEEAVTQSSDSASRPQRPWKKLRGRASPTRRMRVFITQTRTKYVVREQRRTFIVGCAVGRSTVGRVAVFDAPGGADT
eukprot:567865-Prymnesium_polylepis.1